MENVVLIIHLILALCLIGIVLLQRSEGGGLGMGGGGGGGIMSNRGAATALGKLTWGFAIAFIITSMTLTVFAAQNSGGSSVIEQIGGQASEDVAPSIDNLLPPTPSTGDTEGPRAD